LGLLKRYLRRALTGAQVKRGRKGKGPAKGGDKSQQSDSSKQQKRNRKNSIIRSQQQLPNDNREYVNVDAAENASTPAQEDVELDVDNGGHGARLNLARTDAAAFDSSDPRYVTFTREVDSKKGGAPPNEAYRTLLILCHPIGLSESNRTFEKAQIRCPASALCDKVFHTNKRGKPLITHAKTCRHLPRSLRELAEETGAKGSLGASMQSSLVQTMKSSRGVKRPTEEMIASGSNPSMAFPVEDWTQLGKEELIRKGDLALLIWLCDSGVAYRAVDHPMFKRFVELISRARFHAKSSTCILGSQLRDEASNVRKLIIAHLRDQRNLTLTFDGQTTRLPQTIYTVHVTTSDRRTFLIKGDISDESHNAEYICGVLTDVAKTIGPWCIAAVCSDNTGNTRKGRQLFCSKFPQVINMADCCHKLNLLVQDIALLSEFQKVSRVLTLEAIKAC
jgi:hypothetical protein